MRKYRPGCLVYYSHKLIERSSDLQMSSYLSTNFLHVPVQSAYRKFHSTETALLKVVNDMRLSVDNGNAVILALLHQSAAIDTVDHQILFQRLQHRFGFNDTVLGWWHLLFARRKPIIKKCHSVKKQLGT